MLSLLLYANGNDIIKAFIYIKNSIIDDTITNISDLFSVSGNESTNVKNLINIMNIFKASVNFGASITKLLLAFMNLVRVPINGFISLSHAFSRR